MNEIPGSWVRLPVVNFSCIFFPCLHSGDVRSKVLNTIKSRWPAAGRPMTLQQLKLNKHTDPGPKHSNFICIYRTCWLLDLIKLEYDELNHKFAHMNIFLIVHIINCHCKFKYILPSSNTIFMVVSKKTPPSYMTRFQIISLKKVRCKEPIRCLVVT